MADELATGSKPPWEIDGRRWHTRDRVSRSGRPARWDGRILERVVDRIQELGEANSPRPTGRSAAVRIEGTADGRPTFFQATTEQRVGRDAAVPRQSQRIRAIGARAPVAADALPRGSDAGPLRLRAARASPTAGARSRRSSSPAMPLDELEAPGFDAFLARAVDSYRRIGTTGSSVAASKLADAWAVLRRERSFDHA